MPGTAPAGTPTSRWTPGGTSSTTSRCCRCTPSRPPRKGESEKAAFQRWFEEATLRWTSGDHDEEYDESFAAFSGRVETALDRLVHTLPARGTAVVLTSGGPIAWATAALLADDTSARTDLWLRLNPVSVNTGVSTIVCGSRGITLVSFNAHDHLSPDLLTYR